MISKLIFNSMNATKNLHYIRRLFTDMSFIVNIIAGSVLALGYISPYFSKVFQNIGLFALSGSITNWLAIHMLFEKVPFLYGSGVIELRFQDFKSGIKNLVMSQFFNKEGSSKFMIRINKLIFSKLESSMDFESLYKQLVEGIISSPAGSIIGMMGGQSVLEPLKATIINKIKAFVKEVSSSSLRVDAYNTELFIVEVDKIISNKLDKLTPVMVKKIVQDIIKKHLGWLIVWGGVFGGIVGLIASIFEQL